jgi:hypothetical protein
VVAVIRPFDARLAVTNATAFFDSIAFDDLWARVEPAEEP